MTLIIDPDGTGWCVYGEALDLAELGELTITAPAGSSRMNWDVGGRTCLQINGPVLGPFDRAAKPGA